MKRSNSVSRRGFLIGAGTLAAGGAAGGFLAQRPPPELLSDAPPGWYLVARAGAGDERLLVASDDEGRVEHRLDAASGAMYLDAAASPDGRLLAVLKRVPRGSMPSDALAVFDRRTFRKLAETEVQIDFQDIPPFHVYWSADSARLAVPYNHAGRTLVFSVKGSRVLLQELLRRGRFRYHPTRADLAVHELTRPNRGTSAVVRLVPGGRDQTVETLAGIGAEWSPDGATLAYMNGAQNRSSRRLLLRDEASGAVVGAIQADPQARAWSPDSARLAIFATLTNDPLGLARLVPRGLIPGWNPGAATPAVVLYDTKARRSVLVEDIPPGFQLAHLQWMNADWLLVVAARAALSFVVDRHGERRRPVPVIDDFTPLVGWVPLV